MVPSPSFRLFNGLCFGQIWASKQIFNISWLFKLCGKFNGFRFKPFHSNCDDEFELFYIYVDLLELNFLYCTSKVSWKGLWTCYDWEICRVGWIECFNWGYEEPYGKLLVFLEYVELIWADYGVYCYVYLLFR